VVQLRITTGKLSPEERQMIITEFDKGLAEQGHGDRAFRKCRGCR
jgi:hypothetical protein